MNNRKTVKFRLTAFLMCALLMLASVFPLVLENGKVDAADTVTIYFDTGGSGHSSNGWSNGMTVYYVVSSNADSSDQGVTPLYFSQTMTETNLPSVRDPDNSAAKLWKLELPSSDIGKYISFSGYPNNQAHWNRSARRNGVQIKDKNVFYATGTEQDGYWQTWTTTLKVTKTDYAGKTFQIANLTSQSVAFDLLYYSDDGTNIYLSSYTDHPNQVISARNFGVTYTIPSVASGTTPYSDIKIIRRQINGFNDTFSNLDNYSGDTVISGAYSNSETGTLIKDYPFTNDVSQSKCIGKIVKYGITQFGSSKPQYVDDADNKTLTFNASSFPQPAAVSGSKTLYLEKGTGEKKGFAQYGDASNIKVIIGGTVDHYTGAITGGTTYSVTCLDPDGNPNKTSGNASYVVNDFPDPTTGLPAGTIFTIRCYDSEKGKYDIYNLVWDDLSKDLCVLAFGDAAQVTDTRTVQGINELNGQKYMTVKADFFDYQYDKFNNSQYTYTTCDVNGNSRQTVTESSKNAVSKRPYLAINEFLSASQYGGTSSPMYLGQFWLPLDDNGQFSTSQGAYSTTTAQNQRAGNNSYYGLDQRYWISDQQENGFWTHFGFGNKLNNFVWGANLAFRNERQDTGYKPYDAVAQGLVGSYLEGSDASTFNRGGRLMSNSNSNVSVPYFDKTQWTGTYDTSQGARIDKEDYLTTYENLDFPFFEIDSSDIKFISDVDKNGMLLSDNNKPYSGNYYLFDSQKYSVRVTESNGSTYLAKHNDAAVKGDYKYMVYDNYGEDGSNEDTNKGRTYGLFPFNDPGKSSNNHYYDREDLHYGFGIRYDIDFYMTETGTVNGSANGTPITFTFQGDDDVWVFLDGKLILDMGGAHKNAVGEINFANKTSWISAGASYSAAMQTNGQPSITNSLSGGDWASRLKEGEHTITMFYMERGMLNSNLYCMFNLPTNITKVQLQEDTDFGKVNDGFSAATKFVADSDIFNYTYENKNTAEAVGSAFENPVIGTTNRSNGESGTSKTTALNNTTSISSQTVMDPDYLYLDISSLTGWASDGAVFAAYLYGGTGSYTGELRFFKSAGTNLYRISAEDLDKYGGFQIWREPPAASGKSYADQSTNSNSPKSVFATYINENANEIMDSNSPYWNRVTGMQMSSLSSNNRLNVTAWGNSKDCSWTWGTNITKTIKDTHTYNFNTGVAEDSNGYKPLVSTTDGSQGVTYMLEDMFALSGNNTIPTIFDTRKYNSTGNSNIISLQYGEMSTLSNQFAANSSIRVTQLDKLSSPTMSTATSGSRLTDGDYVDQASGRTVSKYYTTFVKTGSNDDMGGLTMLPSPGIYKGEDVAKISTPTLKHADDMYETSTGTEKTLKAGLSNYSNNSVVNLQRSVNEQTKDISTTFMLSDPEQATNTNVYLRQVIINAVNTADLRLAKYMTAVEAPEGKKFTFTIKFTGVFGDDSATAVSKINTSEIRYYKNDGSTASTFGSNSDSFTYDNTSNNKTVTVQLKANESITIKGIPVGTKYQIVEAADADYTLDKSSSKNLEFDSNGNIAVTEITSDTEADVFNKVKTGAIRLRKNLQNASGQAITSNEEFEYTVTVTSMPANKGYIGSYPITAHLAGTPATKTQVLWEKDTNNVYSLRVNVKPSDGSPYANDVILEGFPVGLKYNVTETAKAGYSQQGAVRFSDNTKTVDNYYIGASGTTGSGESNDSTIDLIQVTNRVIPKGSLTIKKAWKDSDGTSDLSDERMTELNVGTSIGVVLYYSSDSGSTWQKAKDIDNTDVSDITLQSEDGWTQTITRLPTNYTYKIVERNKNGNELGANDKYDNKFIVTYSSNVSLENDGSTGTLTVTNKNDPQQIVMPTTGGTPIIWLTPLGIIAVALAGAALVIYKKKLQGASLIREKKGGVSKS